MSSKDNEILRKDSTPEEGKSHAQRDQNVNTTSTSGGSSGSSSSSSSGSGNKNPKGGKTK